MFNPTIPVPKVSNKFLIVELIFFLIIGLLYYIAPESSSFWNNGFGGSIINDLNDLAYLFVLTPILIFFNLLILWISLIKKVNKWAIGILYIELIGEIALTPTIFTFGDASFFLPTILVSTFLSLFISKEIFNSKIKKLFLVPFTIIFFIFNLFLMFNILAGGGAG